MFRSLSAIGLICAGVLSATRLMQAQSMITVKGVVQDNTGNGLPGVRVEVWRMGQAEHTDTLADGSYSIPLSVTTQIDQLRYSRSDLDPTVLTQLSGKSDQQIGKVVLYGTGKPRSIAAIDEQLHVFETMLIQAWTGPRREAGISSLRELDAGRRLVALPLPATTTPDVVDILDSLKSRKERLVGLYDKRGIAIK